MHINLSFLAVIHGANIRCDIPREPYNGRVIRNSTEDGDLFVEYRCNFGYILVGSPLRHCLSNGMFDGVAPICEGKTF